MNQSMNAVAPAQATCMHLDRAISDTEITVDPKLTADDLATIDLAVSIFTTGKIGDLRLHLPHPQIGRVAIMVGSSPMDRSPLWNPDAHCWQVFLNQPLQLCEVLEMLTRIAIHPTNATAENILQPMVASMLPLLIHNYAGSMISALGAYTDFDRGFARAKWFALNDGFLPTDMEMPAMRMLWQSAAAIALEELVARFGTGLIDSAMRIYNQEMPHLTHHRLCAELNRRHPGFLISAREFGAFQLLRPGTKLELLGYPIKTESNHRGLYVRCSCSSGMNLLDLYSRTQHHQVPDPQDGPGYFLVCKYRRFNGNVTESPVSGITLPVTIYNGDETSYTDIVFTNSLFGVGFTNSPHQPGLRFEIVDGDDAAATWIA